MSYRSFSSLSDHALLRELHTLLKQDRNTTASLLACLAETDKRKLYVPMGHGSLYMYCVRALHMSEDMAFKRIRAARAARRFPTILPALAEGRLHLAGVVLLTPYLTRENADELLAAATHRTKAQVAMLIAERFPQQDMPTVIRAITVAVDRSDCTVQACEPLGFGQSAAPVVPSTDGKQQVPTVPLAPGPVVPVVSSNITHPVEPLAAPHGRLHPLSPGRFALQVTISEHAHEQLRYAQALLGHALSSGDISQVLERALEALVEKLEKHKFAKSSRSSTRREGDASKCSSTRETPATRDIPAHMRRQVWARDQGQCTFVGPDHNRCEARSQLEFDHVEPLARGGQTCVSNLRLLCRAHNQHAAERAYGAPFMAGKRERAMHARAKLLRSARECALAHDPASTPTQASYERDPVSSGPA